MTGRMTQHGSTLVLPVGRRDHIQGAPDAPVTLLEYGDYECPYCGEAYPIVKKIQQHLGEKMRFAFRNFPLTNVHTHAEEAAEAAEAAADQEKFWEMHDYLYKHQRALGHEQLIDHAQRLGLDVRRFTDELVRHSFAERIREDFLSGVRSGVNGTPTFFINGLRHDASFEFSTLLNAINGQLSGRVA
jgi:protein-disulfide isomerase